MDGSNVTHYEVPLSETEVRQLRDKVYGRACTDKGWEGCKDNWMKPENQQWLLNQLGKMVCVSGNV